MKRNHFLPALVFVSVVLTGGICSAAQSCLFSTPLGSAVLQFGTLDPANAVDTPAAPATIQFTCTRSPGGGQINVTITETRSASYNIAPAGYKMQNSILATEYLPYQIVYALNGVPITFPYTGKAASGIVQTVGITGSILGLSYQDAHYGPFQDTINFTITP